MSIYLARPIATLYPLRSSGIPIRAPRTPMDYMYREDEEHRLAQRAVDAYWANRQVPAEPQEGDLWARYAEQREAIEMAEWQRAADANEAVMAR